MQLSTVLAVICREPYRLFFPLGIVAATIGIMPWFLYAFGLIDSYSGFLHSSMQTMVYINSFIIGFLMTAFPRFTQTFHARWWEVVTPLGLFLGMGIFLALDEWIIAEYLLLGWYGFLMYFVLSRVMQRRRSGSEGQAPVELIWLPVALFNGITGTIILILGQTKVWPAWALHVGKPMMEQGFLVSLVVGIAGFLIPRLMGTYEQKPSCSGVCGCQHAKGKDPVNWKIQYYLMCASLFFISFFVEGLGWPSIGYGLRAAAVTAAFIKSNILVKTPQGSGFYVWMAWASVRLVVSGLWGAALLNNYQTLMLHITFIGGFSLMIFAIASMVIMSHAGEGDRLASGVWIIPAVTFGVLVSLVIRLLVGVFPDLYFQLLAFSAGVWIASAGLWLLFMLPMIFKVPHEDEFEKMHEAAKAKLKGAC